MDIEAAAPGLRHAVAAVASAAQAGLGEPLSTARLDDFCEFRLLECGGTYPLPG